eukprot:6784394-Prymnesium_polylepis.1
MDDCPILVWCGSSAAMLKHRHPARSRTLTSSGCVIDACIRKAKGTPRCAYRFGKGLGHVAWSQL